MADEIPQNKIKTFDELAAIFDRHMLIADRGVLRVVIATIIGNQLDFDPIWTMFIAPSSSGKTEFLSSLNDIEFAGCKVIFPISDLTSNAFVSGMKKSGKETSLLFQIPFGGIMSFKDFTSLLSKNKDDKKEIMGQMREIYDGSYEKRTGNGEALAWKGKVGSIAGSTEVIYEHMEAISAMGDRFIMYRIDQPDRSKVMEFVMKQKKKKVVKTEVRQLFRASVKSYVEYVHSTLHKMEIDFDDETEKNIISVADFCTRVRSGVISDEYKGYIKFVPSKEMPMRMTEQLIAMATAFLAMNNADADGGKGDSVKITESDMQILYKIAFDSIPIKRRIALKYLTKYKQGITTAGLAIAIGYQTDVVKQWLAQLNSLGICDRDKNGGGQGDKWKLKERFRDIMVKFEKIQVVEEELVDKDILSDEDWLEDAARTRDNIEQQASLESFDTKID